MKALADSDPMPFGIHQGKPMEKVPASYLLWLWDKDDGLWQEENSPLRQYIIDNFHVLEEEDKDTIINHRP